MRLYQPIVTSVALLGTGRGLLGDDGHVRALETGQAHDDGRIVAQFNGFAARGADHRVEIEQTFPRGKIRV